MSIRTNVLLQGLAMAAVLLGGLSFTAPATAEEEAGLSIPVSEGARYLGEWTVSYEFRGNPVSMSVRFLDVDGQLGATLRSPAQPQPTVVSKISTVSRGLKLEWPQAFGETEIEMTMVVRLERGDLHGEISAEGGAFQSEVHGDKSGKIPGRATLDFFGNDLKITYGALRTNAKDYPKLAEVQDGEVFEFVYSRATKLFTDADLSFGDAVIRTENAGPDYPGVYSLWLKRVGDGWHLVFNSEADVWGTQHDPSKDVAEIPLTVGDASKEYKQLSVDLEEAGDSGLLRIAWGDTEWTADFELVQ